MLLESGQSAVIGGLTTDSEVQTESRIPFISRIPVLGELFKHRTRESQLSHLIVFITPAVIHSPADTEMLLQRELSRRRGALREELKGMLDPSVAAELDEVGANG